MAKTWADLKSGGSRHYQTDGVQPIDLYRDLGIFRAFALASIIKYAARNVGHGPDADPVSVRDMDKIIHYVELLKAACGSETTQMRGKNTQYAARGKSWPNPGSDESVRLGCRCGISDNEYGQGCGIGEDGAPLFWITADCPLHGRKKEGASG